MTTNVEVYETAKIAGLCRLRNYPTFERLYSN